MASDMDSEELRAYGNTSEARFKEQMRRRAEAREDLPNSPNRMRGKAGKIVREIEESGSDEPIFVLRAKDIFTPMVLTKYLELVEQFGPNNYEFAEQITDCLRTIKDWQHHHTDRVRYPD